MDVDVVSQPVVMRLAGRSLIHAPDGAYGPEVMALLDRMRAEIGADGPGRHAGIDHVVYEAHGIVFVGVEGLGGRMPQWHRREMVLRRYVRWCHVGPRSGLGDTWAELMRRIQAMGLTPMRPCIERYGRWRDVPARVETDIYIPVA